MKLLRDRLMEEIRKIKEDVLKSNLEKISDAVNNVKDLPSEEVEVIRSMAEAKMRHDMDRAEKELCPMLEKFLMKISINDINFPKTQMN